MAYVKVFADWGTDSLRVITIGDPPGGGALISSMTYTLLYTL